MSKILLTLCLLGMSSDFSKSTVLKISLRNTYRVSISMEPDQSGHFVGLDLDPNCLQWLSADDAGK